MQIQAVTTAQVGEVYTFRILGGGYGAVQVIAFQHDDDPRHPGQYPKVQLLRLDLDLPHSPSAAEVDAANPAHHILYSGETDILDELWVSPELPWWVMCVEGAKRTRSPSGQCRGWGGWESPRLSAHLARMVRQGHALPAVNSHDDTPVLLDLGQGVSRTVRRDTWRLFDMDALCPDEDQPIDWAGFDVLRSFTEITLFGKPRGFFEHAAVHLPHLRTLQWVRPDSDVLDFSHLPLTSIRLRNIDRPLTVCVPPSAWSLALHGSAVGQVTVDAPDLGECFMLETTGTDGVALPLGVQDLSCLTLGKQRQVDFAPLAALPRLISLKVWHSRSKALNIGALRSLKVLRSFAATDLYGFDPEQFPTRQDCPLLGSVSIDGLRVDDARVLKIRLKGLPSLDLRKARSAKWLEENYTNPFKDWDDVSDAFAKKAMALWKDALKAARELTPTATASQAQVIVSTLVQGLNKLDKKGDIDTVRREEACEAICRLVREHLGDVVSEDAVQGWIDEEREW